MASGTQTLSLGSTPVDEASVAVTGQAAILSTSQCEAWIMGATTADNDENAHLFAGVVARVVCGVPTAGVGFTIYWTAQMLADGDFKIQWVWA